MNEHEVRTGAQNGDIKQNHNRVYGHQLVGQFLVRIGQRIVHIG